MAKGYPIYPWYWRKGNERSTDFNIHIALSKPDGTVAYESVLAPGSRINPPQSWKPNSVVKDNHRIFLDGNTADLRLQVKPVPAWEKGPRTINHSPTGGLVPRRKSG
jgi:hypothetical protein